MEIGDGTQITFNTGVNVHNEFEAEREIKELSLNAKAHLSHILRNGLQALLGLYADEKKQWKRFSELEQQLKDLGL